MILEWKNKNGLYSAIFEDDGKVAYGYLLYENTMVGDVWIYNCSDAPSEPEWTLPDNIPFANPKTFILDEKFTPVKDKSEITISWVEKENTPTSVLIYIRGNLIAKVQHGSKPGWCKLAKKNGPLALVFN
jgi:hypothetical protein